ncbi:MAG: FliM/FliN family flagellar motor switch protein [Thermomicrobiales bacterium]
MTDRPAGESNLSQREIDMLLASMNDPDVAPDDGNVSVPSRVQPRDISRSYDFRHPDKFSRDQIRTVQAIHDTFGRLVSNTLAAQTRSSVAVQFSSIDQMPFSNYLQGLEPQTCIFVVPADPLPGHYVIGLSLPIAMHILDRLQGGSGLRPRIPANDDVTDIERALMTTIGRWLIKDFTQAWEEIAHFQSDNGDLQLQHHQVRQVLGSEVSLAIVYEVRLFEQIGQLSVAIPGSTLDPVSTRLSASVLFAAARPRSMRNQDVQTSEIAAPMGRVSLSVAVNLGRATLTMADIGDLRVGDVIVTDQDVHGALEMSVSGETLFSVRPGRIGGRMAAQVIGVVPASGFDP